jgi:hypothetical protein
MREIRHPEGHTWVRTSVVEDGAIDHERQIAEIAGAGNDVVRVRVAQRVDFDLLADPITRHVHPVRITVAETFEMSPAQISELMGSLSEALEFAARLEGRPWLPQLVAEQSAVTHRRQVERDLLEEALQANKIETGPISGALRNEAQNLFGGVTAAPEAGRSNQYGSS